MTSDAGSGRIRYRHNFQGQLDDTMKYITAMPNKTLVEVLDVVCAKYGQRLDFIAIYSSTWDLELFSIMARKISFESILLTAGTVSAPDVLWAWLTVNLVGNQWRKFNLILQKEFRRKWVVEESFLATSELVSYACWVLTHPLSYFRFTG